MKRFLRAVAARVFDWASPPPQQPDPLVPALSAALAEAQAREDRRAQVSFIHDLVEARWMRGAGAWLPAGYRDTEASDFATRVATLRESPPVSNIGAYGDIELALQNVEWRREVNITWLEFSRWGIQQIILICRLYYIKNTIVRRLVNVCADYVFARGVEISSPDKAANDTLEEFFARNKATLGQNALVDLEKRKDYDGNLFFAFFSDTQETGQVNVRTIDALEIMEVITDADDSSKPQYYRRVWTQRRFDPGVGTIASKTEEAWYPALGYDPGTKPQTINSKPVMWDTPVYHRKSGNISTWMFGCPRSYPMIDWARTAKDFLTNCATLSQALAEIAKVITTKGGQQALEGLKNQFSTQVGPGGGQSLWDKNPPAVTGAVFASGPGTKVEAFKTQGAGLDPESVRQFKLMCCMVAGVPETFLADVSTGNLATATSLDRPTETGFLARQEEWVEDLTIIATHVLTVSSRAPKGRLREAMSGVGVDRIRVVEMKRERINSGYRWMPLTEAGLPKTKASGDKTAIIEVKVSFPAIREGDIPAQIKSVVEAMTLDNKGGQVVGIDEKEGVRKLLELLDIAEADELVETMYPDKTYKPDRSQEELTAPIGRAEIQPGGTPKLDAGRSNPVLDKKVEMALRRVARALQLIEVAGGARESEPEPASNGRG